MLGSLVFLGNCLFRETCKWVAPGDTISTIGCTVFFCLGKFGLNLKLTKTLDLNLNLNKGQSS